MAAHQTPIPLADLPETSASAYTLTRSSQRQAKVSTYRSKTLLPP